MFLISQEISYDSLVPLGETTGGPLQTLYDTAIVPLTVGRSRVAVWFEYVLPSNSTSAAPGFQLQGRLRKFGMTTWLQDFIALFAAPVSPGPLSSGTMKAGTYQGVVVFNLLSAAGGYEEGQHAAGTLNMVTTQNPNQNRLMSGIATSVSIKVLDTVSIAADDVPDFSTTFNIDLGGSEGFFETQLRVQSQSNGVSAATIRAMRVDVYSEQLSNTFIIPGTQ